VGTLAVQFAARALGARVIAIASGSKAAKLLTKLGADAVIDGRKRDVYDRLLSEAPEGFDAILALAGGPVLNAAVELVKAGGRVAYPNGVEPEPKRRPRVKMTGYDADANPTAFARLARAVTKSRFTVPIARTFPLSAASKAHTRVERGHVLGRIVLKIR
jgi:NADPH:quinone reductase-like Zn-dependent oxidoreductase